MSSPIFCRCSLPHTPEGAERRERAALVAEAKRIREIMALTPANPSIGQMLAEAVHIMSNCACHPRGSAL